MSKWSRTGKLAKGTAKFGWWGAKGVTKAVGVAGGTATKGGGSAGRALLGGGKYRRSAEQANERIAEAFGVADAALARRDEHIARLESGLARCRCGA